MGVFDGPNWQRNPSDRFDDDLVGLDRDDPEAQAFARHLDKMQRNDPGYTVESSIRKVADFAESGSHLGGLRWWFAVLIIGLMLFGVFVTGLGVLGQIFN